MPLHFYELLSKESLEAIIIDCGLKGPRKDNATVGESIFFDEIEQITHCYLKKFLITASVAEAMPYLITWEQAMRMEGIQSYNRNKIAIIYSYGTHYTTKTKVRK